MIFVTLGSQKFQFDRLLRKIDEMIADGLIQTEVFAQSGASTFIPQHFKCQDYVDRDQFAALMGQADLVITHGGTGAIISAVKQGKKVIAIPRLAKYGEHVDDHQVQLLKEFGEMGIISACADVDELPQAYAAIDSQVFRSYQSNTTTIIASIEEFLLGEEGK